MKKILIIITILLLLVMNVSAEYTPKSSDKKILTKIEKLINKKFSKKPKTLLILLKKIDKILIKEKNKDSRKYYLISEIKNIIENNNAYKDYINNNYKEVKEETKENLTKNYFNKKTINFLKINKDYESQDGLTVKIKSIKIDKKKGYDLYKIDYILTNNSKDKKITEGTFKAFYKDKIDGLPQYGFFGHLFPGESIDRSYTFKSLKSDKLGYFAYGKLFYSKNPKNYSLIWKFNY